MAGKNFYQDAREYQPGMVTVRGSVAIGATGAVGTITGRGFTFTRTSAGLFLITFLDNFSGLLQCLPAVRLPTPGTSVWTGINPGAFTPYNAATLAKATLQLMTFAAVGATNADPNGGTTGATIDFACVMQNTSIR